MNTFTVSDYCSSNDYNGHIVLLRENGKTIIDTRETHGDFPFDALGYEIVSVVSEEENLVVLIVK